MAPMAHNGAERGRAQRRVWWEEIPTLPLHTGLGPLGEPQTRFLILRADRQ